MLTSHRGIQVRGGPTYPPPLEVSQPLQGPETFPHLLLNTPEVYTCLAHSSLFLVVMPSSIFSNSQVPSPLSAPLLAVCPWAIEFTSQSLRVLLCTIGIKVVPSARVVLRIKWANAKMSMRHAQQSAAKVSWGVPLPLPSSSRCMSLMAPSWSIGTRWTLEMPLQVPAALSRVGVGSVFWGWRRLYV